MTEPRFERRNVRVWKPNSGVPWLLGLAAVSICPRTPGCSGSRLRVRDVPASLGPPDWPVWAARPG